MTLVFERRPVHAVMNYGVGMVQEFHPAGWVGVVTNDESVYVWFNMILPA